jgi:hypothetical protein
MPRAQFRPLQGAQKFLFFFIPDHVAGVSDDFVKKVAGQVLPETPLSDLGWIIYPVPDGAEPQQRAAMGKVVSSWLAEQPDQDAVRFDQKVITLKSSAGTDAHLTCLIAYLEGQT